MSHKPASEANFHQHVPHMSLQDLNPLPPFWPSAKSSRAANVTRPLNAPIVFAQAPGRNRKVTKFIVSGRQFFGQAASPYSMNRDVSEGMLGLRSATLADATVLANLNQQLIQDEGHRNPMIAGELVERMRGWLAGEYAAVIAEEDGAISSDTRFFAANRITSICGSSSCYAKPVGGESGGTSFNGSSTTSPRTCRDCGSKCLWKTRPRSHSGRPLAFKTIA